MSTLKVDTITNAAGTGSPNFSQGIDSTTLDLTGALTVGSTALVSGVLQVVPNTVGKDTFNFGTSSTDQGRFRIKNVDSLDIQLLAGGDSYITNGNLGIGTTAPSTPLEVVGGSSVFSRADTTPTGTANAVYNDAVFGSTGTANTGITIFGTGQTGIAFADAGDNDVGQIRYQHSSETLELGTNAVINMSIDSAGDVTIPNGGLILSGGGDTLDHYEEFEGSSSSLTVLSGGGSFSSGSPTIEVKMARVGKLVSGFARYSGTYTVSGNCNTVSTATNFIPASFQPTTTDIYVGSRQRYSGPGQRGADIEMSGSRRFAFSFNSGGAISTCESNVDYRWTAFSYYVD